MTSHDKWMRNNTTMMTMRFNNDTDKDIMEHLKAQKSKQGYIKELIRADMKQKGVEIPHPSKADKKKYAEYLCDLEFGEIGAKEDFKL